ncbi:MAG TPA: hypothetical protein PL033_01480 [Candidatus Brocadiia bacterium]|nr:hypothetical protein [Candidatus Brocadiia bacterium]
MSMQPLENTDRASGEIIPDGLPETRIQRRNRFMLVFGLPLVLAIGLYSRTFFYDLTGDDFCLIERAINSGPWWTFFIGPDTLKDVLKTEEWKGDVVADASDVFRPGLIWYFKLGWTCFGKWDPGYRLLKFMAIIAFIYAASRLVARLAGVNESWFMAAVACLLLINDNVQWITTLQCCETATFVMAAATCAGVLAHDRWARTRRTGWLGFAALLLAFGLCNRENAVALPVMAAILDFTERRRLRTSWPAWAAYGIVIAAYFLVRYGYYGGTLGQYTQIGRSDGAAGKALRVIPYSPLFLPRCAVRASISRISLYEALIPIGAAILVFAARGAGRETRRLAALLAAAFVSFGPGYMMGFHPQHMVMPAAMFVGLVFCLSMPVLRAISAGSRQTKIRWAGLWALFGTYAAISLSIYAGWGIAPKEDLRVQSIRREVRRKVCEIAADSSDRQMIVFLLVPIHMRFNLFENTMSSAVRFWTDGRCEGHTVFTFYAEDSSRPYRLGLVRLKPLQYALELGNVVFALPQIRILGSVAISDFATVAVKRKTSADGADLALIELSGEYAKKFPAIHVLVFDGEELRECDKVVLPSGADHK